MISQMVSDRERLSKDMTAAVHANIEEAADAVALRARELRPKGHAPDLRPLMTFAVERLERNMAHLLTLDEALDAEVADDVAPRALRDAHQRALYDHLVTLRRTLTAECGPSTVRAAGFSGDTPNDATVLVSLARGVLDKVGKHPPRATVEGVTLDMKKLTAPLADLATALATDQRSVAREEKEASTARNRRDQALTVVQRDLRALSSLLEAALLLAGLDDRIDHIPALHQGATGTPQPPAPPTPA